jgi:hypothetical protein
VKVDPYTLATQSSSLLHESPTFRSGFGAVGRAVSWQTAMRLSSQWQRGEASRNGPRLRRIGSMRALRSTVSRVTHRAAMRTAGEDAGDMASRRPSLSVTASGTAVA